MYVIALSIHSILEDVYLSFIDVNHSFIDVNHSNISQRDLPNYERWGAGVETQKNVRGEIGGWGRVPFNETYAPSLSPIYDGA